MIGAAALPRVLSKRSCRWRQPVRFTVGAASDNAASIRVLTKCGFLIVGEGRGFAHGRNEETDEVVLRLDA